MSGVVGKNEDRYSGQIATVVGIETIAVDKDPNLVAKWTMEPNVPDPFGRQYELAAGFGSSGSSALTGSGASGGTNAYIFDGSSWAATGSLPSYRQSGGSVGTVSAGYTVSGSSDPVLSPGGVTTEFDGTSWALGGALSVTRNYNTGGAGIQTAGLQWGGSGGGTSADVTTAYIYNGTSWSATGSLGTAVLGSPGCGTTSAALAIGGNSGHVNSDNQVQTVQEFDGTSWANGGGILQRRAWGTPAGTQTAAHTTTGEGAYPVTVHSNSETYDGTSWTTADPSIVGRYRGGSSSGGTTNNFIIFQGGPGPLNYACSFISPSEVTAAEGTVWYNTTDRQLKVATLGTGAAGTWASGGTTVTAMNGFGTSGFTGAALKYGGNPSSSGSALSESYNGSTWSSISSLLTGRRGLGGAGTGTESALAIGGDTSINEAGVTNKTEIWDGSSWQQSENLGANRSRIGSCGTVNNAFRIGGYSSAPQTAENDSEIFDGVSWTYTSNPSARFFCSGAGNPGAALMIGGYSGGATSGCQEFNSLAWSGSANLLATRYSSGGAGTQTAAIAAGGIVGGSDFSATAEEYNGTTWTSMGSLTTGRSDFSSAGNAQNILAINGYSSGGTRTNTTEEFTKTMTAVVINKMGVPRP